MLQVVALTRTSGKLSGRKPRIARQFGIKPGRTVLWWDNFVSSSVVVEEWRENFRMSKENFPILCEGL